MAPQAACVHEGGGVERRAAHHERERQRRQREAAGGSTEPAAEEATDVEAVSAADVLAGVEESGPNYALPTAREGQRERRRGSGCGWTKIYNTAQCHIREGRNSEQE